MFLFLYQRDKKLEVLLVRNKLKKKAEPWLSIEQQDTAKVVVGDFNEEFPFKFVEC